MLLAIETATATCSVALSHQFTVVSRVQHGNNIQSQVLLEMIDAVLVESGVEKNQIDVVAVGQGPGSFTGLRIGVGVAQGIAFAVGCPMVGASSLAILANQYQQDDAQIIAAIDARMSEVYWCNFEKKGGRLLQQGEIKVSAPQHIRVDQPSIAVGNAWLEYQQEFQSATQEQCVIQEDILYPNACSLLELAKQKYQRGQVVDPCHFLPEYVRNNVAKKIEAQGQKH